jgi:hypothetical protein
MLQPGANLRLEALRSVTVAALCRKFTKAQHRAATVTERRAECDAGAPGVSEVSHGRSTKCPTNQQFQRVRCLGQEQA